MLVCHWKNKKVTFLWKCVEIIWASIHCMLLTDPVLFFLFCSNSLHFCEKFFLPANQSLKKEKPRCLSSYWYPLAPQLLVVKCQHCQLALLLFSLFLILSVKPLSKCLNVTVFCSVAKLILSEKFFDVLSFRLTYRLAKVVW